MSPAQFVCSLPESGVNAVAFCVIHGFFPPHPNPLPRGERELHFSPWQGEGPRMRVENRPSILLACLQNMLRHCAQVLIHFLVGRWQNGLPVFVQPLCASLVVINLICMYVAVNFDHQLCLGAVEIHYKMPNGMLAPELVSAKLAVAHNSP